MVAGFSQSQIIEQGEQSFHAMGLMAWIWGDGILLKSLKIGILAANGVQNSDLDLCMESKHCDFI